MTASLRIRASIVVLIGALLIPIVTSSLRGLTHVLTCRSALSAEFDVALPDAGDEPEPVLLDPSAVTRPGSADPDGESVPEATLNTTAPGAPITTAPERTAPAPVCGGIVVDMTVSTTAPGHVLIVVPVRNTGTHDWQGTVRLQVGSKEFPVGLGRIRAGEVRTKSIAVAVEPDVERVTGQLLLGP